MNVTPLQFGRLTQFVAAIASVLFVMGAGAAMAGDRAQSAIIGFSPDGRYVAYEQYGTQDGSGYLYAAIQILDVAANESVAGAPVAVMLTEDDMSYQALIEADVALARDLALEQASPVLAAHGIVPGAAGTTLVYRPFSDLAAPSPTVPFSIGAAFSPYLHDENVLQLTLTPASSAQCLGLAVDAVFLLRLDLIQADGARATTLHDETGLPEGLSCPSDYRIHSVVVYAPDQTDQSDCCADTYAMLVLLAVEASPGFEGPDTRYVGVAGLIDFDVVH